jgi:hypothetical protein
MEHSMTAREDHELAEKLPDVWAHLSHCHKLLSRMEGSDAQEVRYSLYSIAETLRVWNQRIIDVGVIAMRSAKAP